MPRYLTKKKAYVGGAMRQEGETFFTEQPVATRQKLNKDGKRTGKKVGLPSWLVELDNDGKAKAEADQKKESKAQEQKEQDNIKGAAGVDQTPDFMGDGEVTQV